MLMMALFFNHSAWFQVIIFYANSVVASVYLAYVLPFNTRNKNLIEIVNECMISVLGIGSMCLLGLVFTAESETSPMYAEQ